MGRYKKIGTHQNWGLWQKGKAIDYIGNMTLNLSLAKSGPGASLDYLKDDINEYMAHPLGDYINSVKSGTKPDPSAPKVSVIPRVKAPVHGSPSTPRTRALRRRQSA